MITLRISRSKCVAIYTESPGNALAAIRLDDLKAGRSSQYDQLRLSVLLNTRHPDFVKPQDCHCQPNMAGHLLGRFKLYKGQKTVISTQGHGLLDIVASRLRGVNGSDPYWNLGFNLGHRDTIITREELPVMPEAARQLLAALKQNPEFKLH